MGIRAAATQVARAGLFYFRERRIFFLVKECSERHDKAGSAVAAHQSVAFDERLLHRIQTFLVAEAFDSKDFLTLHLEGKFHTSVDRLTAHKDSAPSARGAIANFFGACKLESVSEDVEQSFARLYGNLLPVAVDLKNQFCRAGTDGFLTIQSLGRLRDSCCLG